MHLTTSSHVTAMICAGVTAAFVLKRGRLPEYIGFILYQMDFILSPMLVNHKTWVDDQVGPFMLDSGLLIVLLLLGRTTRRIWPACAAVFQLLQVAVYPVMWLAPGTLFRAFYNVTFGLTYLLEGALIAGCLFE